MPFLEDINHFVAPTAKCHDLSLKETQDLSKTTPSDKSLLTAFDVKSTKINITRSTQRAQTSLTEADHYSHIVHCKNVEPWL